MGCSRVAGDYYGFHSLIFQKRRYLTTEACDGFRALVSVRHASGITEVDDALVRELSHELVRDGESADA